MAQSEFARIRHALIERGRRLEAAGLGTRPTLPTWKQLKTPQARSAATAVMRDLLADKSTTVGGVRAAQTGKAAVDGRTPKPKTVKPPRPKKSDAERRAQRREASYKRRLKQYAEKYNLTEKEQNLLKAARTLGLPLKPSQAKEFGQYLEYRYAMNKDSSFYLILDALDDYLEMTEQKKADFRQIKSDFEQWLADRAEIGKIQGTDSELWQQFLNR